MRYLPFLVYCISIFHCVSYTWNHLSLNWPISNTQELPVASTSDSKFSSLDGSGGKLSMLLWN